MNRKRSLVLVALSLGVLAVGTIPASAGSAPKPRKVVEKETYFGPGEVAQCANKDLDYGGVQGIQLPPTGIIGPALGTCFEIPPKLKKFDVNTADSSGGIVITSWNFSDNQGNLIVDGAGNQVGGYACDGPNPVKGVGGGLNNPIPARAAEVYIFQNDPVSAAGTGVTSSAACPNVGGVPTSGTETVTFHVP